MRNNINIAGISEFVHEVEADAAQSIINYGVKVQWQSGTRTKAIVQNAHMGGQKLVRSFEFDIDEPNQLLGLNTNPNPQEYLMAGVAGCMSVTFVAGATLLGITLESLSIELRGELDLCGFMGMETDKPVGFQKFDCIINVDGDGTPEQYEVLRKRVMQHSPNFVSMVNGVEIVPEVK